MIGRRGAAWRVLALLAWLLPGGSALAGDRLDLYTVYEVRMMTAEVADALNRRMSQIRTLFAAVRGGLNEPWDAAATHRALGLIAKGGDGVRSLIIIGADGMLRHDSVSLPVESLYLGDRGYFSDAMAAPGHLVVGLPAIGRSSQLPFIPFSMRLDTPQGPVVVVAVVNPDPLLPAQSRCAVCGAALVRDNGAVLLGAPRGYLPPPEVAAAIVDGREEGIMPLTVGRLPIVAGWKILPDVGVGVILTAYGS